MYTPSNAEVLLDSTWIEERQSVGNLVGEEVGMRVGSLLGGVGSSVVGTRHR